MGELWLHVGGPKTGSSAIQSAAVINRDALLAKGTFYPPAKTDESARRGAVTSGNGALFAAYLSSNHLPVRRDKTEARVQEMLERARVGGYPRVLISSELMADPDPIRLNHLADLTASLGWRLHILYYVRHIADQAVSIFGQQIKRGTALDPAAFLRGFRSPTFGVRTYASNLGRENVSVVSYDVDRDDLIRLFFNRLGVSDRHTTTSNIVVNRSASLVELASIRAAAAILSPEKNTALTNLFRNSVHEILTSSTNISEAIAIEPDELKALELTHKELIEEVNRAHFSSNGTLALHSPELKIGPREPWTGADPDLVFRIISRVRSFEAASS